MPAKSLQQCAAWKKLQQHYRELSDTRIASFFDDDEDRATRYASGVGDLYLNFSRALASDKTLSLLMELARQRGVEQRRDAMFSGDRVNVTEHRAVLHTALRNQDSKPVYVDGVDVMPEVEAVLERMQSFSDAVRQHRWLGHSGKPITDVVNIGIGGSHLGPQMVTEALSHYRHPEIRSHFVSNVDGTDIIDTLNRMDPETVLFIIASKSFTTQETMTNAHTARRWFLGTGAGQDAIARHFVAASTNKDAVASFGIDTANMFGFWDWVGGRYSLWSAIGLPVVLSIGYARFIELLEGAHVMDRHFVDAPLQHNWPVILAMLGVWYRNFCGYSSYAILPYAQRLRWLPDYLQQADMESNGKQTTMDGVRVSYDTGPVIWGSPGTNGQHAYFQLLHQGTEIVPADFIAVARSDDAPPEHQLLLLANCLAQSEALMLGRDRNETLKVLQQSGLDERATRELLPHRVFPGNRPSNTIILKELSPRCLGSLIALYEHKIFVQGVVWGVNSFDQWGVELGKQLANQLAPELQGHTGPGRHPSTRALLEQLKRFTRD